MYKAHYRQLDKGGMPYVFHPYTVASTLTDEYAVCVALLHDVVEDTDITLQDLEAEGFPREVVRALKKLTHQPDISYDEYIRAIKRNPLARQVKLADLRHNSDLSRLQTITEKDVARIQRYKQAISFLEYDDPAQPKVLVCTITFPSSAKEYYYLTDDSTLSFGDQVLAPTGEEGKCSVGFVKSCAYFTAETSPIPIERMKTLKTYHATDASLECPLASKNITREMCAFLSGHGFSSSKKASAPDEDTAKQICEKCGKYRE